MKTILSIISLALMLTLSGCVAYDPYYVQPAPVYVAPRPVYVAPPVYYRPPPSPRCTWVRQWDGFTRTYRNVKICR